MKKLIIFTDLDGTLLDYSTYSFEAAFPALQFLKEKDIPLIICSSKTRREIEYYREKLENPHPFISENGGCIFIPKDYFKFQISNFKFQIDKSQKYYTIKLGASYKDLRIAFKELRKEGFDVRGFGDMTIQELTEITNMSINEAEMAKERDFDESFIFNGNETETQKLFATIKSKGFNFTQGRFYHILGNSDKGKAVSILTELYESKFGEIITVGIGDSPNDIPMLERVDYPIIVMKQDGSYDSKINVLNLIRAEGIGPKGWNSAVIKLIKILS
jgi:mannosyl-3-phosphoglycerate phosphatase